jgi:DNA-directed RNA polymerase subunit M/transcription elongation factor TFIIS
MLKTCPDCKKLFVVEKQTIEMLKESFIRNPNLKIICSDCGYKLEIKYWLLRKQENKNGTRRRN